MLKTIFRNNAGAADRAIRVVLGLGLLSLAFIGPATSWGYLGIVPLLTAAIGTCPAYTLLGVTTCPAPKAGKALGS